MKPNYKISDVSSLLYWLEREGWSASNVELNVNNDFESEDSATAEIIIGFSRKEESDANADKS